MKVLLFEAFTNDKVTPAIDELESEISSSRMRVGPSMDKLPWAMEVVVFEFIKDRAMEANSSGNVDIDDIINQLEDSASKLKQDAVKLLVGAGMGEDEIKDTYETGLKVVKLKNYNLVSRPIEGKRGIQKDLETDQDSLESTINPDESDLDKEFRSARNRGRNILRKNLDSEHYRKPSHKKENVHAKPTITVRPIKQIKPKASDVGPSVVV